MHKKLISNIILISLIVTMLAPRAGAKTTFSDLEEGSWYYEDVKALADSGIVSGFPDGTFRPDDTLNADQFIKMVVTALGEDPGNGTNYWASTYIEYAEQIGLLENIEKINYKKPLQRGEIVCIISKALDILNENIEIEACGLYDLYGYTPAKYIPHVLKTYNAGIMIGYPNNTFRYDIYINRAEACAVIRKLVTPITRRERQITSLTPVPVCYSYIKEEITEKINEYEGNKGCLFECGKILCNDIPLGTLFYPDINSNISETIKLMYDNVSYPVITAVSLPRKTIVRIDCFNDKKLSHNSSYAMFSVKYYDAPTGYTEVQWGYDTMFMKLEINRLSDEGLLNTENGLPDVYYEYKIKSLMRLIFGIEKGDIFSKFILDRYIRYSKYIAGDIPSAVEFISVGGTKLVFFSEGGNRQLCFTFSEE